MSSIASFVDLKIAGFTCAIFLSACGGGGGGDSNQHSPVISNLQTTRQSAFLNDGDGSLQLSAQVDFSDSGGDVNSFTLKIYNSSNDLLQELTGSILGASGITSGVGGAALTINTTIADDYRFELFLTDAEGNRSNTLGAVFPVSGPKQTQSNLPDSGANRCFNQTLMIDCPADGDPFYGQDFMYSSNEMGFTGNNDGTVTDLVTGLVWQQQNQTTYNWYEASATFDATHNPDLIDACELTLGGRTDWRLPSRLELMTIIDYSSDLNMLADSALVLDGPDYWVMEDEGASARYIDFAQGSITLDDKTRPKNVRCVSGQLWGVGNFIDNADGTVSDLSTELMWHAEGMLSGNNWQAMLANCESLEAAGYQDWRLADIKELATTIGAEAHLSINPGLYCSSTTIAEQTDSVWMIQFSPSSNYGDVFRHGAGNSKHTCTSFYSRCVR